MIKILQGGEKMSKLQESEEIKNLYVEYASQNIEMPKDYYKVTHKAELLKIEIKKSLQSKELKQKLEELYEAQKELCSIDCEQCFVYGYSLGSKLTAESFLNIKENTNN